MSTSNQIKSNPNYAYVEGYLLSESFQSTEWFVDKVDSPSDQSEIDCLYIDDAPSEAQKFLELYQRFINLFCDSHKLPSISNPKKAHRTITSVTYAKDCNGHWSYTFNVPNFQLVVKDTEPKILLTHQEYEISDFVTVSTNSLNGMSHYELNLLIGDMELVYLDMARINRFDVVPTERSVTKTLVTDYLYREFKREYEALLKALGRVGHLEQDKQRLVRQRVVGYRAVPSSDGAWRYKIEARDMSLLIQTGDVDKLVFEETGLSFLNYITSKLAGLYSQGRRHLMVMTDMTLRVNAMVNIALEFEALHATNPTGEVLARKNRIIHAATWANL